MSEVKVLIVPRLGYTIKTQDLAKFANLGGEYAIASLNAPKVSSSTYRLHKDRDLVTPSVRDYIYRHNLYGIEEGVGSRE